MFHLMPRLRFFPILLWISLMLAGLPAQGASTPPVGTALTQAQTTAPDALKTLLFTGTEAVKPAMLFAAAGITVRDTSKTLAAVTSCVDSGQCDATSYCAKPAGACGTIGTCNVRPEICIALYDPVCGCDGKTYSNSCTAARAGTTVATRGACNSAAPAIEGFWLGDPLAQMVMVFGSGFEPMKTEVLVNSLPSPFVQVIDPTLLSFLPPSGDTRGPIVVTTPSGSATSSTSFGDPLVGLQITGVWPSAVVPGQIVFVFGSGFTFGSTKISVNGVSAPLMQILDPGVMFFLVPVNATTGFINITTPAGSATSGKVLTIK